jgi:hypothetical protein
MESFSENWWLGSYPKYSIKSYTTMPIYARFKQCSAPFSKGDHNYREAYWKDDNCFIFEWYDRRTQEGEKFGLDHNSYTFFYEHWFLSDRSHIVVKTWLRNVFEWGVVITHTDDVEESEIWYKDAIRHSVKRINSNPDGKETLKIGRKSTDQGIEDFTKRFWETKEAKVREKQWKRGSSIGKEKLFVDSEQEWGESWVEENESRKQSEWHKEKGKEWGKRSGKTGNEEWEEEWERDSDHSFEEKQWKQPDKTWGIVRSKSSGIGFKLEWEGKRPELADSPVIAKTRKKQLRSKPGGKKAGSSGSDDAENRKIERNYEIDAENRENKGKKSGIRASQALCNRLWGLAEDVAGGLEYRIGMIQECEGNLDADKRVQEIKLKLQNEKTPQIDDPESIVDHLFQLEAYGKEISNVKKGLLRNLPSVEMLNGICGSLVASAMRMMDENDREGIRELQELEEQFYAVVEPCEKMQSIAEIEQFLSRIIRNKSERKKIKSEEPGINGEDSRTIFQSLS